MYEMYSEPPLEESYKTFKESHAQPHSKDVPYMVKELELPLIDLTGLSLDDDARDKCVKEIGQAATEWGFFQVVNHGVPGEVLGGMIREQREAFKRPFHDKTRPDFLSLSPNSYRWGNPKASCVNQFFWSEALHVSVADVSAMDGYNNNNNTLRSAIDEFATKVGSLAEEVAQVLGQNLGAGSNLFKDMCPRRSSYVRMNRYPPCPFSSEVFGLLPHTDSDLLTIVHQDTIGGLQLLKDGSWINVKPNPNALIINIGDMFEALSNGMYKSIKHRVVAQREVERFSSAYFLCPSKDTIIESFIGNSNPSLYRKFSFQEYKDQIHKDVQATGDKVGLSRFLL